ncbi:hypothetical protein SAMN04487970_10152 [Paenibacillus tianmuensis]|uniref:Uncharacterized protein n=1 Tax=Paenibacillus tianmuensis TaxID=624147 RepID=A0A1G4REN5_9BACL|nr:hypothetical protein SAMN04487970_10152 [Paenibacillus tianmuensis]
MARRPKVIVSTNRTSTIQSQRHEPADAHPEQLGSERRYQKQKGEAIEPFACQTENRNNIRRRTSR